MFTDWVMITLWKLIVVKLDRPPYDDVVAVISMCAYMLLIILWYVCTYLVQIGNGVIEGTLYTVLCWLKVLLV